MHNSIASPQYAAKALLPIASHKRVGAPINLKTKMPGGIPRPLANLPIGKLKWTTP